MLDSVLALPAEQRRLSALDESSHSLDTSFSTVHNIGPQTPEAPGGPSIFTENYVLMDRAAKDPESAEQLLKV